MSKENYQLMCDATRHIILFVSEHRGTTAFISKIKSEVGLHRMPTKKFEEKYPLVFPDYPIEEFVVRTIKLKQLGVKIAPMALRHFDAILNKEQNMAKPTEPVSTKAVAKTATPAAEKAPKAPKSEPVGEPRNRRDKIEGTKKIKAVGKNPARVGTTRHAIVETILQARTVSEALDSVVTRKDGTDYKIGTPDLYFALDSGLIEIL